MLLAYILAVLLLDEQVTASAAVGSGLILAGVYLVALLGRRGGQPTRSARFAVGVSSRPASGWLRLPPSSGP